MSPVQSFVSDLISKIKSKRTNELPLKTIEMVKDNNNKKEDVFFKLVASWKQTRDLAVASDCKEAIKVADQMFPFLSPSVCGQKVSEETK